MIFDREAARPETRQYLGSPLTYHNQTCHDLIMVTLNTFGDLKPLGGAVFNVQCRCVSTPLTSHEYISYKFSMPGDTVRPPRIASK